MAQGVSTTTQFFTLALLVFVLLSSSAISGCYGDSRESANHLVMFDAPPEGVPIHLPAPFDIRTNFSGTVHLVESRDFRLVVNVTAPTLGQAYDVTSRFVARPHGGMMLEVKQGETTEEYFNPTWLLVTLAILSLIVAIYTAIRAIQWYRLESDKGECSSVHKSLASSSHRGTVYRSRNSIPMGTLQGDGLRLDDVLRGEDELRQVREMPEEEEAEALEMEQLKKLKFKEDSEDMSVETEDSSDPQERNFTKSRIHLQNKTVHKEFLKKSMAKKGPPSYRRTQLGKYEGVPTNDTDETDEDTERTLPIRGGSQKALWRSGGDLSGPADQTDVAKSTSCLSSFGRRSPAEKESNIRTSDNDLKHSSGGLLGGEADPKQLVMADVHPGGKPVVVSITPRDGAKPSRPGNIYVPPSELKAGGAKLSTFGMRNTSPQPAITSSTASTTPSTMTTSTPIKPSSSSTPKDTKSGGNQQQQKQKPPELQHPLQQTPASITHQDVTRNYQDSHPRGHPAALLSMSDIQEDPREDDQSGISGSLKSTSLYGSSEIFEIPDPGNTYYNLDSDIDIPPLDSDDNLWSDSGLPSPRLWPMQDPNEKGKTNDDIKLIPGALKSPGPNTGRLVNLKPRPNSSINLQPQQQQQTSKSPRSRLFNPKGKGKDKEDAMVPPPPTYEEVSHNANTAFEFPPPPQFLQVSHKKKRAPSPNTRAREEPSQVSSDDTGGDYVQIKRNGKEKTTPAANKDGAGDKQEADRDQANGDVTNQGGKKQGGGGGGGGRKAGLLGPTYMNVTILATLCVLTLATGVLSALTSEETRVDIIVFAPAHFLTDQTRIFFNELKDTEAKGLKGKHVLVYDTSNPLTARPGQTIPACNGTCKQGCDEARGECICLKGYRLGPNGGCIDVNECMEGKARCDKAAGCYNRKGSYDCICGEDFYGNGKTCRDCQQGCPKDHYEVQPCSADKQKICKVCQPKCGFQEFESKQCTNFHDRQCSHISQLALPFTSTNVMLEERSRVRTDGTLLEKFRPDYVGFPPYRLLRGTDFAVDISVRYINPVPHFLPVNLSQPYDLDQVAPEVYGSFVVKRYCPSPVPDYYVFSYKQHKDLTYKLTKNGSAIEACETHQQFGQFLGNDRSHFLRANRKKPEKRETFVCSQPGSLTNNFLMEEDFFHSRTRWVDKSKRCQRSSEACESCTAKCGTDLYSGNPNCAIDKEGRDDGTSPRLMTCYNCCVKKNCSVDCKDYHRRRCQPEQCLKGNVLEFSLKPSWVSNQDGKFFCHIRPLERQRLLEVDYSIHHLPSAKRLYNSSIRLYGDEAWRNTSRMKYSDGILNVNIDSGLDLVPDFVEGVISTSNNYFKVGTYKRQGSKFGSSRVNMDYVYLRPSSPVAVPEMPEAKQDCTNHDLDGMNLATNMENPYIPAPDMEAVANNSLPFTVHHKRRTPQVKVTLDRDTPLLKRLYQFTYLKPNSFKGNLFHNGSHWVINVSALVSQCPGYLGVQIQDPNNATINLFDTDMVVDCPKTFYLTFGLPTHDEVTMYKDIMVVITDKRAVHHYRLYHISRVEDKLRRKQQTKDTKASLNENLPYASKQRGARPPRRPPAESHQSTTPDYPIDIPYLIGIAGFIVLLLSLSIIGLCFFPDIPVSPKPKWYHPVFAVVYMVFQFVYSVIISASVFCFILMLVTRPYVRLVNQHGQKGGVTTASSQLELLQLQRHLEKELARQDSEVDAYQMTCMEDVKKIVMDMNNLHKTLLKSTADTFERHRLDLLLDEQKLFVRKKLTKELQAFRDDYLKVSRAILRRIKQDATASYDNIQHNNTWLVGARFIHKLVTVFQEHNRKNVQTFMEWTGINVEESSLDIDLSFSLPALPRLDDIQAPPEPFKQPTKRDIRESIANEMIRSIQVHNNWFFPLADSVLGAVTGFKTHQPTEGLSGRTDASTMLYVFLILLVLCDAFLLAHRMTKAWTTARLLLFGFPEYCRERKDDEDGDEDVFQSKESKNKLAPVQSCQDSPWFLTVRMFFTQTISTTFLPKLVGAIAACVVLAFVLRVSNTHLTVKGLQRLGLYHNSTKSVGLQITVTNGRIQAHSAHINTMEYPSFQALTNTHLSSHKTVFGFYRRQLHGLKNLTAKMYCLHLEAIGAPTGNCSKVKDQGLGSKDDDDLEWLRFEALTHACRFQPVIPQLFHRENIRDHPTSEQQVETLLESLRTIIYSTSHLIIIFLIIIVLKELSFATLWILLHRSGVIRMRIIVEQDQGDLTSQ